MIVTIVKMSEPLVVAPRRILILVLVLVIVMHRQVHVVPVLNANF